VRNILELFCHEEGRINVRSASGEELYYGDISIGGINRPLG
jgi:hypothetical protein